MNRLSTASTCLCMQYRVLVPRPSHQAHPPYAMIGFFGDGAQSQCKCDIECIAKKTRPGCTRDYAFEAREIYFGSLVGNLDQFATHSLTSESNECKRCKVKCIRLNDDDDCQRCSSMKVACIVVPTATQSAKEKDKNKEKITTEE